VFEDVGVDVVDLGGGGGVILLIHGTSIFSISNTLAKHKEEDGKYRSLGPG
jgi:hypothetical protein